MAPELRVQGGSVSVQGAAGLPVTAEGIDGCLLRPRYPRGEKKWYHGSQRSSSVEKTGVFFRGQ